jgi:ABC-type nitrate/sulfonate/bicarbonate transport system substrate-binding protein
MKFANASAGIKRLSRLTKYLASGSLIGLMLAVSSCSKHANDQAQPITELRYQSLPGLVTLPELAEDLGYLAPLKLKYVGTVQGGPQDLQALATNDVDFATAFNGAVIKLVGAKVDIQAVVGSYGSDKQSWVGYYVLNNSPIKSARDLIGKKVAVNTLGAHYEFALRDYLAQQGLTPAEIQKVELTVLPPVSVEQALRAGQVDAAALSLVFRDKATARGGVRQLFADTDLYGDFTAGSYSVTKKFAKQQPEAVRQFVSATAKAVEWVHATPLEQVRARMVAIIHKRQRNENADLIQHFHSYGVAEKGGLLTAQQFQRWIDLMVKNGQLRPNQVDPKNFINNQFNPFASKNDINSAGVQ